MTATLLAIDNAEPQAPERPAFDWEAIARDYRDTVMSTREIARSHGITESAIRKRVARDGWTRKQMIGRAVRIVAQQEPTKAGYLYVIFFDDTAGERFYKIGFSSAFSDRLSSHGCSNPFDLLVACAYFTGDMRAEERYLHERFIDKRVRGEWFQLSKSDLAEIAARSLLV